MANLIFHFILILFLCVIDEESSRALMGYIYLLQYGYFVYITNKRNIHKNISSYLKPSFLIVTYVGLYFGFGCLFLNAEHGLFSEMIFIYSRVQDFTFINIFFLICNYLVFITGLYMNKKYNQNGALELKLKHRIMPITVIVASIMFIFFSSIEWNLSFLGGGGSFSYLPKLVSSLILFIYLSSEKVKLRPLFYFLILMVFALVSYESKREIVFILISIIYIENLFNPIKFNLNFRSLIIGLLAFGSFLFFILISSINRGYGSYGSTDIIDAIRYIPEYAQSDIFIDGLGENFELNFVYPNALNAADMYISGSQETLYGETFLKVLFIPIPKELLGYKPQALISIYSPRVYTGKDVDVSFPVLIYTELLWNFGFLSFVGLLLIIYLLDLSYYKIRQILSFNGLTTYTIVLLVIYTINMQFIRGSGLDLLVIYILISVPFAWFLLKVNAFALTSKRINV